VARPIPAARASVAWLQPKRALAALIWDEDRIRLNFPDSAKLDNALAYELF
jgi:hypothetical protein